MIINLFLESREIYSYLLSYGVRVKVDCVKIFDVMILFSFIFVLGFFDFGFFGFMILVVNDGWFFYYICVN